MHCPFCYAQDTKVTDSRLSNEGREVRRRRECLSCNARFSTYEIAELEFPHLLKKDGRREAFNESKLRIGIEKALEKRPITIQAVDQIIVQIKSYLLEWGDRDIPSKKLGEWVMEALRGVDEIAYVRFASVYRHFQDVAEFSQEIKKLKIWEL